MKTATIIYKAKLDEAYIEYKDFVGFTITDMAKELKEKGILSVYVEDFKVERVKVEGV